MGISELCLLGTSGQYMFSRQQLKKWSNIASNYYITIEEYRYIRNSFGKEMKQKHRKMVQMDLKNCLIFHGDFIGFYYKGCVYSVKYIERKKFYYYYEDFTSAVTYLLEYRNFYKHEKISDCVQWMPQEYTIMKPGCLSFMRKEKHNPEPEKPAPNKNSLYDVENKDLNLVETFDKLFNEQQLEKFLNTAHNYFVKKVEWQCVGHEFTADETEWVQSFYQMQLKNCLVKDAPLYNFLSNKITHRTFSKV